MNLTRRRSAVAAAALVSALTLPAAAASTASAAPAIVAPNGCGIVSAYTQPVLVLVSNVTIKGGNTEHITVLNVLPCSVVRLRVYHGGHTVFHLATKSDNKGKTIFSYKTPTNKNRLKFGGFFPAELTGTSQIRTQGGGFLPFDKKTKFFVS